MIIAFSLIRASSVGELTDTHRESDVISREEKIMFILFSLSIYCMIERERETCAISPGNKFLLGVVDLRLLSQMNYCLVWSQFSK